MNLCLLDHLYSVCQLDDIDRIPNWAQGSVVALITEGRKSTLVCLQSNVPTDVVSEDDWRVLKVDGQLSFNMVGILSDLTGILADAQIPVFVLSTFDTDYLMLRSNQLDDAIRALEHQGHRFI